MANKYETEEALKGKNIVDPLKYFQDKENALYEMDKAGIYDRKSKIDNAFFSAKENEIKEMKKILYRMVGDVMEDPNADEFRWDVKLLVVKKDGWQQK